MSAGDGAAPGLVVQDWVAQPRVVTDGTSRTAYRVTMTSRAIAAPEIIAICALFPPARGLGVLSAVASADGVACRAPDDDAVGCSGTAACGTAVCCTAVCVPTAAAMVAV